MNRNGAPDIVLTARRVEPGESEEHRIVWSQLHQVAITYLDDSVVAYQ